MGSGLTPKQERFVREYLVDLNGTQAAIRAGYSKHTAESQASRLLGYAKVKAAVADGMKRREEKLELKAERVLQELMRVAFVDLRQAFDADGRLKPVHELPEDVARALASLESDEVLPGQEGDGPGGIVRKVRLHDKLKALELLGKHLELFKERVEFSGQLTLEQLILEASKPKAAAKGAR